MPEALSKQERLTLKVLRLAKAQLLAKNHFFAQAVGKLQVRMTELGQGQARPFATDGNVLSVDAGLLLDYFSMTKEPPSRDLMHAVLHCLFVHPYVGPSVQQDRWNLAADIHVEHLVAQIMGPRPGKRGTSQANVWAKITALTGPNPSAEKIYQALGAGHWDDGAGRWPLLFQSCDHACWYHNEVHGNSGNNHATRELDDAEQLVDDPTESTGNGAGGEPLDDPPRGESNAAPNPADQKKDWQNTAKQMAMNMQALGAKRGSDLQSFVEQLHISTRKRTDYARFLQQFAVMGEVVRTSPDEFDYVFYTYGLQLYGNLPLVEPLEYREEKRIRDFVVVVDTSGSVQGDLVRSFLQTTYDMLKSTESFFETVQIRIIQADEEVLRDNVVTSAKDLDDWGRDLELHGSGGTDFRPAFAHVDRLIDSGEIMNLSGLVYFTDGEGTYPDYVPDYKTAFCFYDESCNLDDVPPWALSILIDEREPR